MLDTCERFMHVSNVFYCPANIEYRTAARELQDTFFPSAIVPMGSIFQNMFWKNIPVQVVNEMKLKHRTLMFFGRWVRAGRGY